jgi:Fe-S-cluster-containing dehydrogenase component
MAKQNRRNFLKTLTAAGCAAGGMNLMTPNSVKASETDNLAENRMGVLVDTTVCIGCRKCEWACKNAHGIESGNFDSYSNDQVLEKFRRPDYRNLTVVNKYSGNNDDSMTVKVQCMHCDHPACVSACIVGAFSKTENGTVVWDTDKCIGCRYCMVACPFQIPSFEFNEALQPDIVKCDFCINRTSKGELPACVDICPVEALTYGKKEDLIIEAKKRIKNNPDKYFDHIYGEYEVGGTSWMYISDRDLSGVVFPELGDDTAPGVSESIQHGIFAYFVPPIAIYALLGGIMWLTKDKDLEEEN